MQGQSQQGVLDGILFGTFHVRVISLTFLCALLDGLDLQIIAYVAPVIAKALSLSDMEIGLTFSMGFVGIAVGSIFIASLGDSWGRKTVIILSIVFFSSLILITPFARNFEQLAAVRFLTGVGLGGVLPNAMAISIEYAPRRYRSFMLILAYIGFVAGAAVGGGVANILMRWYGWESVFYIIGTISLAIAALMLAALPESLEYLIQQKSGSERLKRLLARFQIKSVDIARWAVSNRVPDKGRVRALFDQERQRNTILLWIAMFANVFCIFSLIQWLPSLLARNGMPLGDANLLVSFLWLAAIVGSFLFLYISRIMPLQRVLAIYLVLSVILTATLGMVIQDHIAFAGPLIIGIGVTACAAQIGFYPLLSETYPASIRVTGIGIAQGVGRMGAIAGPAIVGVLLTSGVAQLNIFVGLAVPLLISAAAVWNLRMLPLGRSE